MHQVNRSIAPAAKSRHPQLPPAEGGSVRRARPRPTADKAAVFAPRIKRLSHDPDAARSASGSPTATLIGEAGASLVLSRLQGWGIGAQPAMAGQPYDLIADVPGLDMLRIQVKTIQKPNGKQCVFKMRRGFHRARSGLYSYSPGDFDLAAFVCLSRSVLFFYPGPVERISVETAWLRLPGIDCETLDIALANIRRARHLDRLAWLASMGPDTPECAADTRAGEGQAEQAEFDFGFGGL